MSDPATDSCATCKFFLARKGLTFGKYKTACRRFPPISTSNGVQFPIVAEGDWCGEHKPVAPPS